jgi:hypothetical protein
MEDGIVKTIGGIVGLRCEAECFMEEEKGAIPKAVHFRLLCGVAR